MNRMGLEISRLRKDINMTRKQLAKLVGVSEEYLIDVESGKKVINSELANRISKVLRVEAGKLDLFDDVDEKAFRPEPDKNVVKVMEKPVQAIWNDALAGVLKAVPVNNYKMDKELSVKQMPVIGNKVEGHPKDKVFYLMVEEDDMSGFRLLKGDAILLLKTQEIEKDGLFFIEHKERRLIRQIRLLENEKLLLVSKGSTLITETVWKKDVIIIARLVKIEITL